MPTLFRLIVFLAALVGSAYAGMWALATFVKPVPRPMEYSIPASKLK